LSGSDRPSKPSWTGGERRQGERRSSRNRRTQFSIRAEEEERRVAERRSGTDRRSEADWQTVPLETTLAADFDAVDGLIAAATDARTRARAQYSGFKVGAALESNQGLIVTGCNIENASYGLTLCAERVALVKALSEGHQVFTRIVVVADTADLTPPCGPCRQLLWEYCGDIEVILANLQGATARYRLASLLPLPFDRRLLK
jgi:cytidine deaminase